MALTYNFNPFTGSLDLVDSFALASLSAVSPITYNSSSGEFGFDDTDDFTWTGTHIFTLSESPGFTLNGALSEAVQNAFNVVPSYTSPGGGSFNGLNFVPTFIGSGSMSTVNAILALPILSPYTGTATAVNGVNSSMVLSGGGTLTTVAHFTASVLSTGATIGTHIGLDLPNIAAGSTNYAIRTAGGGIQFGDTSFVAGAGFVKNDGSGNLSGNNSIDFASDTDVSVTSPITLTASDIGFDDTANFTWSGHHAFTGTFAFGSDGAGIDVTAHSDVSGYPVMRIAADNQNVIFGPDPLHLTFQDDRDTMAIVNRWSSTTQSRGLIVFAEYDGASNRSANLMGFNAFGHWESDADMTGSGTVMGGRMIARIYGDSPTIASAWGVDAWLQILSSTSGTVSEWVGFNHTALAIGSVAVLTDGYGGYFRGPAVTSGGVIGAYTGLRIGTGSNSSGTFTSQIGIQIDELSGATTNLEMLFADAGGAFFRDGDISISSKADGYLDLTADTGVRVNGELSVASDNKIYLEGAGSDTYLVYDSASSTIQFYVNGVYAGGFS